MVAGAGGVGSWRERKDAGSMRAVIHPIKIVTGDSQSTIRFGWRGVVKIMESARLRKGRPGTPSLTRLKVRKHDRRVCG